MTDHQKLRQIEDILRKDPDCVPKSFQDAETPLTHVVKGRLVRPFTNNERKNPRLTLSYVQSTNENLVRGGWPQPASCHDQRCDFRFHGLPELYVSIDLEEVVKSSHTIRSVVARGGNALDVIIALAQELRKVSDDVLETRMRELCGPPKREHTLQDTLDEIKAVTERVNAEGA